MLNILFLCTGNSCRSIMAEGLLRHYGAGRFNSFSAGSNPTGSIHPVSISTLKNKDINVDGFYSKSVDELENENIDVVITVCDNAAGEACPVFLGKALKSHWGVEDPAYFQGSKKDVSEEFKRVYAILEMRINKLCALDIESLSEGEFQSILNKIGTYE